MCQGGQVIDEDGADAEWFAWWNANCREKFEAALSKALHHVEDKGINLGVVFACPGAPSPART